jgi:hypothetical protein
MLTCPCATEDLKRRRDKEARRVGRQQRKQARDEAMAALAAGKPLPSLTAASLDLATPVAFLFPGQGSQAVGMLQESAALPAVQAMLATAQRVLGYDLLELCSKGGWLLLNSGRLGLVPHVVGGGCACTELALVTRGYKYSVSLTYSLRWSPGSVV